jgi:two-component system OmpR family sensor kinase
MKRLVFWKTLIGFWITTLLISQGFWLMYEVLRPEPPAQQQTDITTGADIAVIAAQRIVEKEGGPALRAQLATWPGYFRDRIKLEPAPPSGPAIVDPQGRRYQITRVRPAQQRSGSPQQRGGRGDRGDRGQQDGSGLVKLLSSIGEVIHTPWQVLVFSFFGGLIFSAILAWYLTRPVGRIRAGFERLAKGDFSTRLGPSMGRRRDEIADLARDFDVMARRLQELVEARDRLLAGVSHELRSPLARLQLAIGLARQEPAKLEASLERIDREASRLDEMVGELLTLSKLESGVRNPDNYFDFAEIVRLVGEDAKFEATSTGVQVEVTITPADADWIVPGDGRLISRAVDNVVRNALRFSPKGQTVRIMLDREDGFYRLAVKDKGPGVPAELLGSLFKPFVQGPGDGQGFGLGLAIAERSVIAHGGTIQAVNEPAGGFTITIRLPRSDMTKG